MNLDRERLIQVMMSKGHSRSTAEGNIAGRGIEAAWREYIGPLPGESAAQPTAQDYAQSIVDAQKKQIEEETKFLDQYTADNPFVFDEELARQSAKAEYEPYYSEMLQDYLSTVSLKRENIQDEKKLAQDLYNIDNTRRTRDYSLALEKADEGFAGRGMFFSGSRQRAGGLLSGEYQLSTQEGNASFGDRMNNLGRQETALGLEEAQNRRDVGRQQQEQVESGILTRKKEAETGYYTPLIQSYYRKFPTASGSSLQGYVVPDYLRY